MFSNSNWSQVCHNVSYSFTQRRHTSSSTVPPLSLAHSNSLCEHRTCTFIVHIPLHTNFPHFPLLSYWISAEPGTPDLDDVLKEIYVLYTDCALKDPFYDLEMPIRCELFIQAVDILIERVEKTGSAKLR